jgi:hypothetical protein
VHDGVAAGSGVARALLDGLRARLGYSLGPARLSGWRVGADVHGMTGSLKKTALIPENRATCLRKITAELGYV